VAIDTADDGRVLSLPFQAEEMSYVRMRPADLARLFGVSRGRVSQWIKAGQITQYADGTIDPSRAASELVKNCDVNRLRARPFRPLKKELDHVRGQLATLRDDRDHLAARLEQARRMCRLYLETDAWLERFAELLAEHVSEPALQSAFDQAGTEAAERSTAALIAKADPELRPVLRELLMEADQ